MKTDNGRIISGSIAVLLCRLYKTTLRCKSCLSLDFFYYENKKHKKDVFLAQSRKVIFTFVCSWRLGVLARDFFFHKFLGEGASLLSYRCPFETMWDFTKGDESVRHAIANQGYACVA